MRAMIKRSAFVLLTALLVSCTSGVQKENQNKVTSSQAAESKTVGPRPKDYYTQIQVDTVSRISYPDFDTYGSYQYKGYKLLVGMYKSQNGVMSPYDTKSDNGFRLLVLNSNNELVFKSRGQLDGYIEDLKFYEINSQSPTLILAEIGNEGPWGNMVFAIKDSGVKEIGNIELAGIDTVHDEYDDISKVTTIKKEGDKLVFRFTSDSIVIDPFGLKEQVIASKGFYYIYNGKEFKAVKE